MRIPAWRGFLAGGAVAAVVYFLLPDTERLASASSAVMHFAAAAGVVVGIRAHRPADRWAWYLIATALLALGTGDSLLYTQFEDLADLCFLGAYVTLTVALLRLVRSRSHGRDLPALLDALVVTISLGVVSWQFLMVPYARDPALSLDQKLTSILLPLADVVLLAVLVRLWSGGGQRPSAYWLLGLAVVGLLAADTAFGVVSLNGVTRPGPRSMPVTSSSCWAVAPRPCTRRWPRWLRRGQRRRPGGPAGAWSCSAGRRSWRQPCRCSSGCADGRSRSRWSPPAALSCSC